MAALNILEKISIDGWHSIDVGDNRGLYVVGIKGSSNENSNLPISLDKLKLVTLEFGIDSGIKDKPITVQRVVLRFNEYTTDGTLNEVTALGQTSVLPKQDTYVRVVSFSDGNKEYRQGELPVSINIVVI